MTLLSMVSIKHYLYSVYTTLKIEELIRNDDSVTKQVFQNKLVKTCEQNGNQQNYIHGYSKVYFME